LLTGLLIGNRALHVSQPTNWNPVAALFRRELPLLDRTVMRKTLEEAVGSYATTGDGAARTPLLAVAAVDLQEGKLRLFHSDEEPITPTHLLASTAIPVLYAPVQVGGRSYWDGDMTRDSLLPLLLRRLRDHDGPAGGPLLIVTVTQRPLPPAAMPTSEPQMTFHMFNLLMRGKFDLDEKLVSEDAKASHRGRFGGMLTVRRDGQPHDPISREFDYSFERIDELIAQGEQQAAQAWKGWIESGGNKHGRE